MIFYNNNKLLLWAAIFFALSILPLSIKNSSPNGDDFYSKNKEIYMQDLGRANTFEKLVNYADSIYNLTERAKFDTAQYVDVVQLIIKERFHHGLAVYSFSENWIAKVSSKLFWSDFSAIVEPNDILKHKVGLCSQQTIVFMEVMKLKNIPVRSVGLGSKEGPGHFLCEVRYENEWHLFDVSVEPNWKKIYYSHKSFDYYLNNKDSLYKVYENKLSKNTLDKLMQKVNYGVVNDFSAKNMRLFHKVTFVFTYLFPMFFAALIIRAFIKRRRAKKDDQL